MNLKYTDEQVLTALLGNGSIRRAAAALGCSVGCVRDRLKDEQFKKQYENAKSAALGEATDCLKNRVCVAVDTLSDIMTNSETAATVKVSAADAILRHGLRYVEQYEIVKRIEALEAAREGDE